jgi:hypothetical protein
VLYFHLFEARMRLRRHENDFSQWLRTDLGLVDLADRVGRLNPYGGSLERARSEVLRLVDEALDQRATDG